MIDASATAARQWPGASRAGGVLRVRGWRGLDDRKSRGAGFRPALLLCAFVLVLASAQLRAEITIYVGKHFEVRDHDAPVKYVFNGQTRVTRVTGSLSTNERVQRLRLRAGWNLVSLAVTAPDLLDQLQEFTSGPAPVIKTLYRWQPATRDYGTIASGESMAAGTVLWVSAQTDAIVAVRGGYVEPSQWGAPGGETFVATPALEVQPLTVPPGVTVWRYEARSRRWQAGLTGDLASLSDLPPKLAPGEAIYVHSNEATDLGAPAPEERIRYYHQDHLGSSSVMTDANGSLVEEAAFYPFGIPRHEHRLRQIEEHYKFTQKERDRESGLHYFEARYLAGAMSRFLSVDPKYANIESAADDPQALNLYAYVRNHPVQYTDPTGLDQYAEIANAVAIHDTRAAQADAQREALNLTLSASTGGVLNRGFLTFAGGVSEGMPTPSTTRLGFRAWEAMGMVDRDSAVHDVGFGVGLALSAAIPSPIKGPAPAPGTVSLFSKTPLGPVAATPTPISISSRAGQPTPNPGRIEPNTRIRAGNMDTIPQAESITLVPTASGGRVPTMREITMRDPVNARIIERLDANRATLDRLNAEGRTGEASALLGRIFQGLE